MPSPVSIALIAASALVLAASARAMALQSQGDGNAPDNPDGAGGWNPLDAIQGTAAYVDDAVGAIAMQEQQSLSDAGFAQLEQFEGFSATPYPDHKGQSIGYGHLIKPGEGLTYVTQDQAVELLAQDVADAERTVRNAVTVPLTQNQFDALVSFTYNVGSGAFRGSTLLRLLNAGDYQGAAAQFPRWVNASGQVNASLVQRRQIEQQLFEA